MTTAKPTLTDAQKEGISQRVMDAYHSSGQPSRAKYAISIGITSSDLSNIEHRKWRTNDKLIGVGKWLRIARQVRYEFSDRQAWATADTLVYHTITAQLEACQSESISSIFCDEAGIGKTYACRQYAETHRNAYYINGGMHKTTWRFIRALAQALGLNADGKAEEVLQDAIYYLRSLQQPLLIIDEAGDLEHSAYLLIKRLYNELEHTCGFMMLGARGLKQRIDRSIRLRRNGFEEVFSRFGSRYLSIVPEDPRERNEFVRAEAAKVIKANGITDPQKVNAILSSIDMMNARRDLRHVRNLVMKQRMAA